MRDDHSFYYYKESEILSINYFIREMCMKKLTTMTGEKNFVEFIKCSKRLHMQNKMRFKFSACKIKKYDKLCKRLNYVE